MATTAELRQILKEDASGKNLYDHLTETLMKIIIERPTNAYDSFELISANVKENPLNPDPVIGKPLPPSTNELQKKINWATKCSELLKNPEEPPEDSGCKFPDLLDDANLYEWAGISFGKGDLYRLYLSIKKLSEGLPSEVEKIRFFGKINTRTVPYWIVEGLSNDEEEVDEFVQEGKLGANKYSYWVTQSIDTTQWTKLPNVTMEQIVKTRKFRRMFTGKLEASVPSYPPFPGNEANLLRAQIARIAGSTSISPDGFFDLNDDDPPRVVPAESEALSERFPKTATELKDPEGWKHHESELNKLGRVQVLPERLGEDGEPIVEEDPAEAAPPLDTIKPEQWTFRVCPGGAGSASGSVVVARSLIWPGAVAVTVGKRFVNLYVGNGIDYSPVLFSPSLPALIESEWKVPVDDESTGGTAALIEQPDTREDPTPPKPEGEEEE